MASSSASPTPPLAKYLASTGSFARQIIKKTRDKAVKNLATFLSDPERPHLSSHDTDKLWKGIFYCFWMSDKALVQQALASELANIFLRGFWKTIVREWDGIDRLRMDKYYLLIRRFVNATFRLLMRSDWDSGLCQVYNDILTTRGGPLCPDDSRVPLSLKYHLADIYLEELDKVLTWDSEAGEPCPPPVPIDTLTFPFLTLLARTPSSHTFERVMSSVLEPLVHSLTPPGSDEPPSKKRRRLLGNEMSFVAENSRASDLPTSNKSSLRRVLLKQVFSIASEEDTRDSNRRRLYKFWKSNLDDDDEGAHGASQGIDAS
ncbi:Nop52-domain-containing protein [Lactarius indigo]|nr:Nop52-domain-containing protein [Lactarius indigo]